MKETNVNQEPIKWGGLLNEFLWICAGVNRKLVRQCPTDYAKYAGQGGLILFTGLMAALSGGYAFHTIFRSIPLAIAFGIFWGLLIFNLDRFIVNTMYSDGKHTISWFELMAGMPRIIIAIFLGIVISTPLEMKIFEDRIETQMAIDNQRRVDGVDENSQNAIKERDEYNVELNRMNAERRELASRYDDAVAEYSEEIEGIRTGKKGEGPIARALKIKVDQMKNSLDDWDNINRDRLAYLDTRIREINAGLQRRRDETQQLGDNEGFCVRYEAFANIKKENEAVHIVSIFIMLMFIIIEIAPTFFKMMVAFGPYDDLLRMEHEKKKIYADEVIGKLKNEFNTAMTISTKTNEEKEIIELKNNKELLVKIANIQSEVLEVAIQKWREEELKKAKNNPSTFIKN